MDNRSEQVYKERNEYGYTFNGVLVSPIAVQRYFDYLWLWEIGIKSEPTVG